MIVELKPLSWLDYAIFALSLTLSIGTGFYHAIKSFFTVRGRGQPSAKDDYLVGGRNLPPLPVALSLLSTFLSGILMLGLPAELFERGPQIWLNFAIGAVSSVLTATIFLPIFHKTKATCLHEYFIHRYHSMFIRRMFSAMFLFVTIIYMSIVIYAPAVALSHVFGVSKWSLILVRARAECGHLQIFGLCTTLYTCVGGIKAVVWTDSIQAVLMYGGVCALIYKGLNHPRVGGWHRVWQIATESGHVNELFRLHPSLLQVCPGTLAASRSVQLGLDKRHLRDDHVAGGFRRESARDPALRQRAVAQECPGLCLPLANSQSIIYYTLLPFVLLCTIVSFVGFLVLAYFRNCNPLETGEVKEVDHITIYFARDVLRKALMLRPGTDSEPTPGLFGLYVSCIMSATLSTLSSGMNSMAAATYEDFLKRRLDGKITDRRATQINKLIVVICGISSTCLAFAAESLGGIMRVCIQVMGSMSGPMVAIFVLAIFVPSSGKASCIISFITANIVMALVCLFNYVQDPYKQLFIPSNTSVHGCANVLRDPANFTRKLAPSYDAHFGNVETMWIARISTYGYSLVGFVLMLGIAVPLSALLQERELKGVRYLTWRGRHEPAPADEQEADHFLKEVQSNSTLDA